MNRPNPTDEELARYLADALPAADRAQIDAWAAADAVNAAELQRLRQVWLSRGVAKWNVEAAWSKVDAQLDQGATVIPMRPAAAWHQRPTWRAAAALLFAAGLGYWFFPRATDTLPSEQQYATAVGAVRNVMLSDSTRVTLGPSSSLRVLAAYGQRERAVVLVGEAVFEVRHDAARPFSVRAANSITLDIGTTFSIRALAGDTLVRVTVQEGTASLRHVDAPADGAVILSARDVGVLTAQSRVVASARDSGTAVAWRDGQLSFDGASFSDVIVELRRWYRVTIAPLDSTLAARRVSATLPSRDLTEALDILRLALRIDIVQRGDSLTFR